MTRAPTTSVNFGPAGVGELPAERGDDHHHQAGRGHPQRHRRASTGPGRSRWPRATAAAAGGSACCAYMPKPTKTEATLVSSTCGRAVVRRSTSGSRVRSSQQPQASRTTAAAANRPSVVAEPQPQSAPLETASSRHTRPTPRPSAPTKSKRCPLAPAGVSGTRNQISGGDRDGQAGGAPEQHPPARVLGDRRGDRQAEAAADAHGGADQGDGGAELLRRQDVPQQGDAERDHAHADALQAAARRSSGRRSSDERAHHRADDQRHGAGQQHAALAVQVAEASGDRAADRRDQQGGGDHPGGVGRRWCRGSAAGRRSAESPGSA